MSEFFDTNVLVYAVDETEPARQRIASGLLRSSLERGGLVISTQVMLEFRAVITRRRLLTAEGATGFLRQLVGADIVPADTDLIWKTFETQDRLGFSIWDAAIVQAAVEAGCDLLYTEDLQQGQRSGQMQVLNPFKGQAVHEPTPQYAVKRATAKRARATRG